MADFSRPNGFRFKAGGMKLNNPPDALPENKYAFLQNVRNYDDDTMKSRPQLAQTIAAPSPNGSVLSLEPTLGVYKIGNTLYVNGVAVDSGYSPTLGASLVPFRPSASPQAWEYVFDDFKASKIQVGSSVIVKRAGTQEPQAPVDAAISSQFQSFMDSVAATWSHGGTTSAPPGNSSRVTDTAGACFPDPASGGITSVQVNPSQSYSVGMVLTIHGQLYVVNDVFPNLSTPISIQGLRYYSGTSGKCVVVPNNLAGEEPSLYTQLLLTSIRRGAIVSIGGELCFVLSSSLGPKGSISFETSTVGTHSAGENLIVADAIQVVGAGVVPGNSITSPNIDFFVNPGIGTISKPLAANPFISGFSSFQPDDYIHFSLKVSALVNLTEMKILFDVGDGSFTGNFYFYSVRPSDIAASVANTLTQLAAAQIIEQRAVIDQENIALAHNQGRSSSSAQTGPGDHQWSEIKFPISALTRVGEDQNKTLQNVNSIQFLFNANTAVTLHVNSITVTGGFQPDVGPGGTPYQYWVVPRDSATGARGNPSPVMRYGVSPRRQSVLVPIPAYTGLGNPDTWDVFRFGGSLTSPRYMGSVPLATASFSDNFGDDAVATSRVMERDNYEPFPSIGPPISPTTANIVGTTMIATFPLPSTNATIQQLQNLLPGNELNVGNQVFTLWTRPSLVSSGGGTQTWFFQFVENAGVLTNPLVQLNEPSLAAQSNQCVWGPDSNGVFFSVQDPLRPGVVNHTNPNNPDSASDAYTDDLCAPSEPLQNGALLSQTSVVFSPNRAWAGYPKEGGSGYRWVEIPVGAGLAAEFGICTDGERIYYVAKDGIRMTSGGPSKSLTDADLYNLFPHEGVFPSQITTVGGISPAPDYNFANSFRLAVVNGYLFFDYIATIIFNNIPLQVPRTLVCDLRSESWSIDISAFDSMTIHAGATLPGTTGTTKNQQLYVGDASGAIFTESSTGNLGGETVACVVATREIMPDLRATSMFGDASLDVLPASVMTVDPVTIGATIAATTTLAISPREVAVINLQGQQLKRSLGLLIQWTDQGVTSALLGWQPAIIPQPETIQNRFGDWDDAGLFGPKFFQGVTIEADTFAQNKTLVFRSSDDGLVKQTLVINHNGQQEKSYSFDPPFVSHLIREEPDTTPWQKFAFKYTYEKTPHNVLNWQTQPTSHGMAGYQHVKELLFAYNAPAQVTFTLTVDGVAQSYTLPATAGYRKVLMSLKAVKGLVFQYGAKSPSRFQIWVNDIEVKVKAWGDSGPYINWQKVGSVMGPEASI